MASKVEEEVQHPEDTAISALLSSPFVYFDPPCETLLLTGLLQTVYFLNSSYTKHIQVGLYPSQFGKSYELRIRFQSCEESVVLTHEEFVSFLVYDSAICEILRNSLRMTLLSSQNVKIIVTKQKGVTVRHLQSGTVVTLTKKEWGVFHKLIPNVRLISDHFQVNSRVYQTYIASVLSFPDTLVPSCGIDPLSCQRINCDLNLHGYVTNA